MTNIRFEISMSLDGYVTAPNPSPRLADGRRRAGPARMGLRRQRWASRNLGGGLVIR